jgi:hypothetical protein
MGHLQAPTVQSSAPSGSLGIPARGAARHARTDDDGEVRGSVALSPSMAVAGYTIEGVLGARALALMSAVAVRRREL